MKKIYSYFGTWLFIFCFILIIPQSALAEISAETWMERIQKVITKTDRQILDNVDKHEELINDGHGESLEKEYRELEYRIRELEYRRSTLIRERNQLSSELNVDSMTGDIKVRLQKYSHLLYGHKENYKIYEYLISKPEIWLDVFSLGKDGFPHSISRTKVITALVSKYLTSLKSEEEFNATILATLIRRPQNVSLEIKDQIKKGILPRIVRHLKRLQKKIDSLKVTTTDHDGEPDNYYRPKCPDQNPGDRKRYKFDTNNNPDDGDYVMCQYWKDGDLDYEIPHANNKKHGISYYYFRNSPHHLKSVIPYTEGKMDGARTYFLQTRDGKVYKGKESIYSEGVIQQSMSWREDGSKSYIATYSGGKKIHECTIEKDGTKKCIKH